MQEDLRKAVLFAFLEMDSNYGRSLVNKVSEKEASDIVNSVIADKDLSRSLNKFNKEWHSEGFEGETDPEVFFGNSEGYYNLMASVARDVNRIVKNI